MLDELDDKYLHDTINGGVCILYYYIYTFNKKEMIAYGLVVAIIIIVILAALAAWWEYNDHCRLLDRKKIKDLPEDEREEELKFYACYNSENRVSWRTLFLASLISTALIWYLLLIFGVKTKMRLPFHSEDYYKEPSFNLLIAVFLIVFIIFYIFDHLKEHHLYKKMSSKVKDEEVI